MLWQLLQMLMRLKKNIILSGMIESFSTNEEKLFAQTEVSLYFLELLNDLEAQKRI